MLGRCAGLVLLLSAAGCNLTPPCAKVSRIICEAGTGEQDACQFVLNRERDDAKAQEVCRDILPAAVALGQDPHAQAAREDWKDARQSLAAIGFQPDIGKADIANKLVNAGGVAGKVVEHLRDHSKEAEENTQEAADRALKGEGP